MSLFFLKPFLLPLAAAALGALLLIHFFTKKKAKEVFFFTHLNLLREVLARRSPARRFSELIKILLRGLALAAIFLALAKPYSALDPGSRGENVEQRLSKVYWFVVDISYSMDYRDLVGSSQAAAAVKAAAALAQELLASVPDSRVGFLAFSDKVHEDLLVPPTSDFGRLSLGLKAIQTAMRPTRQNVWVDYLTESAKKEAVAGVFVFSDLAKHGLAPPPAYPPKADSMNPQAGGGVVFVDTRPKETVNRRLDVSLEGGKGVLDVACFGGSSSEGRVAVTDALTNETIATLNAKPCGRTFFDPEPYGLALEDRALIFSLKPDSLPADDRAALVVSSRQKKEILIVDGEPGPRSDQSESFYLARVLRELGQSGNYRVISADELENARAQEIWLLHPRRLGAAALGALGAARRDPSKKIVLSLGPRTDTKALESLFSLSGAVIKQGAGQKVTTLKPEFSHFELEPISVKNYMSFNRTSASPNIWLSIGSDPLLFEIAQEGASVFVWASTFDLEWTNIALKGIFYALVKKILEEKARLSLETNLSFGDSVEIDLNFFKGAPRLFGPDGTEINPKIGDGEGLGEGNKVKFGPLESIGLYKLQWPSAYPVERPLFLAVNFPRDSKESDLSQASDKDLRELLPGGVFSKTVAVEEVIKNPKSALAAVRARAMAKPLLLAAIVLLGLETGFSLWSRRK